MNRASVMIKGCGGADLGDEEKGFGSARCIIETNLGVA